MLSAANQGGIRENIVSSFKIMLCSNLGILTDEILTTTFCPVKYALYAHSLTVLRANTSNFGAITSTW